VSETYDVVIVGARVGGATLASLLGRRGLEVLLVDQAEFPSDTLSTHITYGDSFGVWEEIGAWPAIERIGAKPLAGIDWQRQEPNASIQGAFGPVHGHAYSLCLRRLVLDAILVDTALETPGVTVSTRTKVVEVVFDHGRAAGIRYERRGAGTRIERGTARSSVVVGADGRFSFVADAVGSVRYNVVAPIWFPFYAYLVDVEPREMPMLEILDSDEAGGTVMLAPCDEGIWIAIVYSEQRLFDEWRRDHTRVFEERIKADPRIALRLARSRRITPVRGRGDIVNFMRAAGGPGWALVGDSGQHKDPIYGQGIGDAVRTARLLADCLLRGLGGEVELDSALAAFHAYRDLDLLPNYDWMIHGQPRGWNRAEFGAYLGALGRDEELATRFVNVFSHGVPAGEMFSIEARDQWREQRTEAETTGSRTSV
jgi:2-polyprenyl-6-methoxyphenol hydroxylase-like FAD-dependent oxidoreductase